MPLEAGDEKALPPTPTVGLGVLVSTVSPKQWDTHLQLWLLLTILKMVVMKTPLHTVHLWCTLPPLVEAEEMLSQCFPHLGFPPS